LPGDKAAVLIGLAMVIAGAVFVSVDMLAPFNADRESPFWQKPRWDSDGEFRCERYQRGAFWKLLGCPVLPASVVTSMSFLLLMPVGALVTALFRNVIGIQSIGIFTPTLLALSQTRGEWKTGTVIFILVFGVGSLCRKLFDGLNLSTISRRGLVLTSVIMVLFACVLARQSLGLEATPRSIVLPVAVMTLVVERFFSLLGKEGTASAVKVLANTVLIAACCFLIFDHTPLRPMILSFPELELCVTGGLILAGLYTRQPLVQALGLGKDRQIDEG
jgi:hypothetical protein